MDKQSAPLRDPQAKFPVQEPEAKAKRTYQPPTITDYGRLSEITQSGARPRPACTITSAKESRRLGGSAPRRCIVVLMRMPLARRGC
ncbi:MAG: lasso RiPP family leader peptide-containing protein [Chloroflexi bacterium]|nr:lasso RiPP family leader peptide-containing protein [Chloroflexota bacterium]